MRLRRQDWIDLAWWCCFSGAFLMVLLLAHSVAMWVGIILNMLIERTGF